MLELHGIVVSVRTREVRMSNAGEEPPTRATSQPWFRPNRTGPGWHPSSWQGWLIVVVVVAAIVTVVVLFRTGML